MANSFGSKVFSKISEISVFETTVIYDALKKIDNVSLGAVIVIDSRHCVIGTLTDGDIRRGLLQGISLDETIKQVFNSKSFIVNENKYIIEDVKKVMLEKHITFTPVVSDKGILTDVITVYDDNRNILETAMFIMAGGLGSRLGQHTIDTPKPMLKVLGSPMLEQLILKAKKFGIKDIFISVRYKKDIIMDYFGNGEHFGVNIVYVEETTPLGTAGSLALNAKLNFFNHVLVINADVLTDINFGILIDWHKKNKSEFTSVVREFSMENPFGTVEVDGNTFKKIVEKPIYKSLINAGCYIIDMKCIKTIETIRKLDMPEFINNLISLGYCVKVYEYNGPWVDVGKKDEFEKLEIF